MTHDARGGRRKSILLGPRFPGCFQHSWVPHTALGAHKWPLGLFLSWAESFEGILRLMNIEYTMWHYGHHRQEQAFAAILHILSAKLIKWATWVKLTLYVVCCMAWIFQVSGQTRESKISAKICWILFICDWFMGCQDTQASGSDRREDAPPFPREGTTDKTGKHQKIQMEIKWCLPDSLEVESII